MSLLLLIVDFYFKRNNAKKRVNRGISKAKAKVAKLEDENVNLRRTEKRLQKRLNRARITLKTPLCMINIFRGGRGGDTFKNLLPLRTFAFTHPLFQDVFGKTP